jgi:hypothetical protein
MGTFAIFEDDGETDTGLIVQLAMNKEGHFRGNLVDAVNNDNVRQIYGALEPETQRIALRFDDNEDVVLECGLWNLTQDSVPLLIHLDGESTELRTLIRLHQDEPELAP